MNNPSTHPHRGLPGTRPVAAGAPGGASSRFARGTSLSCSGSHKLSVTRDSHHELAEILPAQQPHESPRRVLQAVDDFFAVAHPALAQPSAHVPLEDRCAVVMIEDDESLH